ncbi:MAG: hypothetical protein AABY22_17195 [Nanoarchaeota archaeon]
MECIAGGKHNIISISSSFEQPNIFYGKCSKCGEFIRMDNKPETDNSVDS